MLVEPPSEEGLLDENVATAYSTTVFVFFEHKKTVAHSFYAIEIPNPLPCPEFPPLEKPLSPFLEFPADKYARGMRCAKLGSKFYFVGGERQVGTFPSDVYLFDPAPIVFSDSPPPPRDQLLQAVPRMTTGKPTPCVFVADEKLYVLGSTIFDYDFFEKNKSIKFFEVFDPSTSKWTVLDDPQDMLACPIIWLNSVVVGRKVFISGKYQLGGFQVQLTFNLDSHSWTKPSEKVRFRFPHRAELVENDAFYGGNLKVGKLGPFTQEELQDEEKLFSRRISPMDMPEEDMEMKTYTLYNPPGLDESLSLCHIGNRQFCYVDTGSLWHGVLDIHNLPDINEHLRIIRITILQDTSKSEALFNAKHRYSAEYEVETCFSNEGNICDCYALTPEDKEKLMKKQIRKEKKIKKAKKKRVDRD